MGEVLAQREALKAQMAAQEKQLAEEERRLKQLEEELHSGVNKDEKAKIAALRAKIEAAGRAEVAAMREVEAKREAMRRATDAYVDAEERLTRQKQARKEVEDEMLELVLSTGKAKDARLTQVLMKVPDMVSNGKVPDPAKAQS